jgi:hypothetical protein
MQRQLSIVIKQADQLIALASTDSALATTSPRVSGWTVGLHLEHLALVNGYLAQRIDTALRVPPENADDRPKWMAYVLLYTGFIPRGNAQAPTAVVPQGVSAADLRKNLADTRQAMAVFENRLGEFPTSRGRSPHPILGMFTAKQWLRFTEVHNNHHLKIIRAIQS